jgi:hypothetical protein
VGGWSFLNAGFICSNPQMFSLANENVMKKEKLNHENSEILQGTKVH